MEEKMNQIFVGKKHEKFEKKVFSIPAFFFGGIYFAYRKMFVHGILLVLFSTIINIIVQKTLNFGLSLLASLSLSIAVGLYFPIWYRSFYRKKVQKIQLSSSNLTEEQLIHQLQKNGGTSILFAILFIILSGMVNSSVTSIIEKITPNSSVSNSSIQESENETSSNESSNIDESNQTTNIENSNIDTSNLKVLEKIKIKGFMLSSGYYDIFIGDDTYKYYFDDHSSINLLGATKDFDELVTTIYYEEDGDSKIIKNFEFYDTSTNKKIENVKTEDELISKLGYYPEGTHEDILTLEEKSLLPGTGNLNGVEYKFYTLTFKNKKGKQLYFTYEVFDDTENKISSFKKNKQYKVNFEVEETIFEYEYTIINFEEI